MYKRQHPTLARVDALLSHRGWARVDLAWGKWALQPDGEHVSDDDFESCLDDLVRALETTTGGAGEVVVVTDSSVAQYARGAERLRRKLVSSGAASTARVDAVCGSGFVVEPTFASRMSRLACARRTRRVCRARAVVVMGGWNDVFHCDAGEEAVLAGVDAFCARAELSLIHI